MYVYNNDRTKFLGILVGIHGTCCDKFHVVYAQTGTGLLASKRQGQVSIHPTLLPEELENI